MTEFSVPATKIIPRKLVMDLPPKQSAFLWGARKTGKSTYLHQHFPEARFYDFLQSDIYLSYLKSPHLFREELLALGPDVNPLVVVDEIQKIPELLDEIHYLIEHSRFQFILCGSSARKLRRQGVNLLGGRAWKYHFFPLVYPEWPTFDLLKIFTRGAIPSHYLSTHYASHLKAYIEDYLTLEVQAEGLVRNLPPFARFLDNLRFSHGELLNYSNIARECHVNKNTVQEYFHILVDTLMGYYVLPYHKRQGREIITETPKFFLFDVGVAERIKRQTITTLSGREAGQALEHLVFLELYAYASLSQKNFPIHFWRTRTGLEVDFVLGDGEVAIEVKISSSVHATELHGIKAFQEEHHPKKTLVVSLDKTPRRLTIPNGQMDILPIQIFLDKLWGGEIL